jgi:protein kinase C and casein kinase substrate in neurons protein
MSFNSETFVIPQSIDSFWEVNGHQKVVKRTEHGLQMCNELSKLILERAEIEREYAKRLKSWSSKWTESIENGNNVVFN